VNDLQQTARQVRFTNKAFWRNPASAFFTFAFPLMFLVIFTSLLGNGTILLGGIEIKQSTYYVAGMAAFSVISACYTNIAISVCFNRDAGILKRVRGTPLPGHIYILGRIVHAVIVGVLLVIICALFGKAFYGATLPSGVSLIKCTVMLLVGSASFAALGLAVTPVIPNADASPAVVNATILPLLFLSGIFIPAGDDAPEWLKVVGRIFPVKHFADGMGSGFLGLPFKWSDVIIVAVWGLAGVVIAARYFSWEPRR